MLLATFAAVVHLITNKLLVNLGHLDLYLFFFFLFHSSSISAGVTGTIVSLFFKVLHSPPPFGVRMKTAEGFQ